MLFARNPAVRLPQIRIRAMRYNSDKAGDKFSDMKSFEGPLHSIFEEAYTFIVRNTPSLSRFIKGNPKRQDSPLYPEEAVREALINALAHRDYSAASGGVSIHVLPHRPRQSRPGQIHSSPFVKFVVPNLSKLQPNPDWASLPLFDRTGWKRMAFREFAESIGERAEPKDGQDEIYVGWSHLGPAVPAHPALGQGQRCHRGQAAHSEG